MPSLTPVSPERHGVQRWRRFSSYAFVQAHPLVPIVLGEETQVASALPILFARDAAGSTPYPVALTRLGATTALVAPNGAWRGSYVPSLLRVHPFAARATTDGQFALLVDEDSGLLSDNPDDLAFFDASGQIAPELAQVAAFFRTRIHAEARTRIAMAALSHLRLLTPFEPPEGMVLPQEGLMYINAPATQNLGRVDLAELHRKGALGLVHAAQVGRHHLTFLAAAEAQLARGPASTAPAPSASSDPSLGGFFDAIAASQVQDGSLADFIRTRRNSGPEQDP